MQNKSEVTGFAVGNALMKYRTGIIIGAVIGLYSGGIWGLVFGGVIGGLINRAVSKLVSGKYSPQMIFFKATFSVMGHVAKADGRVTEDEIRFARDVMARMNLNEERQREAILFFNEGKSEDFDLAAVVTPLSRLLQRQAAVKIMFIEIQLQAALADGQVSQNELQVIQSVCALMRMSAQEMSALMARMQAQQTFNQGAHGGGAGYQSPFTSDADMLKDAYGVLGVTPDMSDAEIKKAYRRLMSQHHPDKLVAKGLPPEMMKLAKEKTQEIQAAYDRVKSARKA